MERKTFLSHFDNFDTGFAYEFMKKDHTNPWDTGLAFISAETFRSVSLFKHLPPTIISMPVRVTEGTM